LGQQPRAAYPKGHRDPPGLREGERVDIETDGDRIVIVPARRRYELSDLLRGVTPQAMREAFDWGPDRGREDVK